MNDRYQAGLLGGGSSHDAWHEPGGLFGLMTNERIHLCAGLDRRELDRCLERLLELKLVALRPWSAGRADGVWQVMPVPRRGE